MATVVAVIASTHHPFFLKASTASGDDRPPFADEWVRKPNKARVFGGASALDRMMSGNVADLYVVRQYVDGQRG